MQNKEEWFQFGDYVQEQLVLDLWTQEDAEDYDAWVSALEANDASQR